MNPSGRLGASVEDLPNELLTKIFHFVQDASAAQFHEPPTDDPYDKLWFLRPEFISESSRFPLALAHVSPRWHSIITAIPEFWTILVLAIDSTSTPGPNSLSVIQTSLDRSQNLPLDILVTQHPDTREPTAKEERSHLLPLVALLSPHFPRCRSISFYTTHSSALPQLGRDFAGELPNLVELKLECMIKDSSFHYPPFGSHSATYPVLHKLVIDGRNFTTMTHTHDWPAQFPAIKSLSIVHLPPRSGGGQLIQLYDFLEILAGESMHLDFLRLRDAELINAFSEEFSVDLNLSKALVLEDLNRSFVHELLISLTLHSPELHVARCSLNGMGRLPETATLRLEDIALSDNLSGHLKNWYGRALTLVRCDGFDDAFLDMLGAVSTYSGAPNLVKLAVVDCPNFTVGALKKMVEARNKAKKGAIEDLVVSGKGPALDTDGTSWLKDQVKSLEWNTRTDDGVDTVHT